MHDDLPLTPMLVHGQPNSYQYPARSQQNLVNLLSDKITESALDEVASHIIPQPFSESGRKNDRNASELERNIQLAPAEQEKSS
jgi:hypothetical protein